MQETQQEQQFWSLGWENPLEREMATYSSILAWKILWAEEPGGLQGIWLQKSQTQLSDQTTTTKMQRVYMILVKPQSNSCTPNSSRTHDWEFVTETSITLQQKDSGLNINRCWVKIWGDRKPCNVKVKCHTLLFWILQVQEDFNFNYL